MPATTDTTGRPIEVGLHLLAASNPGAGVLTSCAELLAVARRAGALGSTQSP